MKYEVKWNGYGSSAVAYITGPGVDVLRLDPGDNIDTEAIAEAMEEAYNAGREAERGEVADWARQELAWLQRSGERNLAQEAEAQVVLNRATGLGDGWRHVLDDEPEPEPRTRYARVIRARNGRPDSGEVMAYLPGNYQVVYADDHSIMIAGEDNSGWTLDGYVIPRLASGLITAEEWTADRMEAFLATAGRSEADKIAEIAASRDDGRF